MLPPVRALISQKVRSDNEAASLPLRQSVESLSKVCQPVIVAPVRHRKDNLTPNQGTRVLIKQCHQELFLTLRTATSQYLDQIGQIQVKLDDMAARFHQASKCVIDQILRNLV